MTAPAKERRDGCNDGGGETKRNAWKNSSVNFLARKREPVGHYLMSLSNVGICVSGGNADCDGCDGGNRAAPS